MSKYTPWFPPEVKPVRDGVYQRLYDEGRSPEYCKFEGGIWYVWGSTPELAARALGLSMWDLKWRGLTKTAAQQATKEQAC